MNPLLLEIGKQATDHWKPHLALPGVAFLLAVAAVALVDTGALTDTASLRAEAAPLWRALSWYTSSATVAVTVTLALVAAGLLPAHLARALGARCGRRWLAEGVYERVLAWNTPLRRRRWRRLRRKEEEKEYKSLARAAEGGRDAVPEHAQLNPERHRSTRYCPVEPSRPTWMADRLAAVQTRISHWYGIDLYWSWPHLLQVLPDRARDDLVAAEDAFTRARTLSGWGLLHLSTAALCGLHLTLGVTAPSWPLPVAPWDPWASALLAAAGTVMYTTGRIRAEDAIAHLADLMESYYDLYGLDLARALGLDVGRGSLAAFGVRITNLTGKFPREPTVQEHLAGKRIDKSLQKDKNHKSTTKQKRK
ncbi:hypothetical protein [Nocardiopsis sp. CC223A]|uniref:hypothetical protein n=1 Tax=Nocardiopsis sp. CC223A TaxID=3044051 RepID=UPI00278C1AC1|nr:hypothetical protein [Nocardiopsis sp. CC223A]